ncbi:glycosyltransferase family 1 protein [Algoriphagus limi]|uniref:Glycosyltransferase family 1 protein n=1 Tax=Algoriphagus limi TaxID=2975273 RepID=A0ABT2G4V8_9BACT|nr:glycosyltransferase family 1 protein [Algoriphagus limi]MCS5488992.1 glycosyltransferase family 1 protein [Algoriphagus limi]
MRILFLGETYRADAITWIKGVEQASGHEIETRELFHSGSRTKRKLEAFLFIWRLIFSKEKYDIVLAERSTSYGFFSLAVRAKVRVVAQQGISDIWPSSGFRGWYKGFLQRRVYRRVDLIHAWGYVMTYAMLKSGADPSRILVRPKGLDLSKFRFFEKSLEAPIFTAIVTRSLFPIYHHDKILTAFSILKEKGIHLNCLIIGDGVEMERLVSQTETLGLQKQINWLGRISNEDLPNYLAQAEIYIAFPETEGVSASLFEAMACGCFPIVTDLPANRAFIANGQNGLLAESCNPVDLANKIEQFLKNPKKYQRGIKRNRKYIEQNCNMEDNMKYFFNRYAELLAQK